MKVLCVFVLLWAAAVSLQARGIRGRKSVYHPASRRPRSEKWVWLLDENFKAVSTGTDPRGGTVDNRANKTFSCLEVKGGRGIFIYLLVNVS